MRFIIIEKIETPPNFGSLNPEIAFKVNAKYSNEFTPIEISGDLSCEGKKIATVHEQLSKGNLERFLVKQTPPKESNHYHRFFATLTEGALEYLEEIRHKNKKRDVVLKLRLYFKVISTEFTGHLQGVISSLFDIEIIETVDDVTISSSDWTHDFLTAFGKGKYIVLEIPQPDFIDGSSFVNQKINDAIDCIPKMQKELLSGEWTQVIKESRPIWELVNEKTNDNTTPTELHNYLNRSGLSDDAIGHFTKSISELFQFSSKFIHRIDKSKGKINPEITASKEDAYLIYSLCLNVVNLITCKIKKLNE